MNQLFELYGFSYPMEWLNDSGGLVRRQDSGSEAEMLVTTAITLMCTAGVSFYLRFLVELCRECRPHRRSYWARIQFSHVEEEIAGRQERQEPVARAA
jgi:hypothetical protein